MSTRTPPSDDQVMTPDDPMTHSGARWCEKHERWECAADKANHHASAIRGQAYCKHHVGKPTELAKVQGEANLLAWSTQVAGDEKPLDLGRVVMDQLRLAVMRADLYGEMLRVQVEAAQVGGLVGVTRVGGEEGKAVRSGEQIRGLARLEGEWRDRAVKYAKVAHDMGIDDRHVEVTAEQAHRASTAFLAALTVLSLLPADRDLAIRTFLQGLGSDIEQLERGGGES